MFFDPIVPFEGGLSEQEECDLRLSIAVAQSRTNIVHAYRLEQEEGDTVPTSIATLVPAPQTRVYAPRLKGWLIDHCNWFMQPTWLIEDYLKEWNVPYVPVLDFPRGGSSTRVTQ